MRDTPVPLAERRIFGFGGHEFGRRPEDEALTDFALGLAGTPSPRICLLPTASGDPTEQIAGFYRAMERRRAQPTHISLFRREGEPPLRDALLSQDIIYVGGGSMMNLLALWSAHGLDEILREAWEFGIPVGGVSAGCMCWFQWGITRSTGAPELRQGLGLIDGSACVHYHGDLDRRTQYLRLVGQGAPEGWALDDHAGVLFAGSEMSAAVAGRPDARVWRVHREDTQAVESTISRVVLRTAGSATELSDTDEYRLTVARRAGQRAPGGPLRGARVR
ncbi:MAG: Type 1 glutamine amidotransferase-like domain-containing protein [Solirubrobacterales bacterium]